VTPVAIRISAPPDVVVSEGDGFVDLTVSLSAPGLNTVTVNYSTPQISATSSPACPWDYAGSSGL
jgi:hypothetical protein